MRSTDRPDLGRRRRELSAALRGLPEGERTLLIVDDDAPLCQRLARAMERRGFVVATADSVAAGTAAATERPPAFAVVDMRLGDGRGFDVVSALAQGAARRAHRHADRLRQHRDRGRRGQGGRDRLSAKAGRCRRGRARAARPGGCARRSRPRTRCRPTGCAGSTSSASSSCASATSRKPPAASRCTAAPCSASSASTPREAEPNFPSPPLGGEGGARREALGG